MPRPRIFALSTFRLSLLAIPLNLAAGLLVLAFVYFSAVSLSERRVDHTIAAERDRLADILNGAGAESIFDAISRRIEDERGSSRLYALRTAQGTVTIANFEPMASDWPQPGQWASTMVRHGDTQAPARLLALAFGDGEMAVIGRDLGDQTDIRPVIRQSLALALACTLVLSLVAGLFTSRAVLRRLNAVNTTASRILEGRLDERVPVQGGGDEFAHLAGNINAMLDRIAELMRATREVTDNVAHDLRSPLNRMRARLELALLPGTTNGEMQDAITAALTEADGLLDTFEALLTIARLDHGVRPDFTPVDLSELVRDLGDYYAPLAEEKGLTLTVEDGPSIATPADRHLLFQALSNAVDNAIRYSEPGGAITIAAARTDDGLEIVVADRGPGIPPERRHDVLRRFVRLDGTRPRPGTGLGLSVVEAVVRHHRGRLSLDDNHPGLRLIIHLPGEPD